jgi:hypothetical protein
VQWSLCLCVGGVSLRLLISSLRQRLNFESRCLREVAACTMRCLTGERWNGMQLELAPESATAVGCSEGVVADRTWNIQLHILSEINSYEFTSLTSLHCALRPQLLPLSHSCWSVLIRQDFRTYAAVGRRSQS